MKNTILLKIILFLILSTNLIACNGQGTLPTKVAHTTQRPTVIPSPSPSPEPPIDYGQLSEAALAALIYESVVDVDAAASAAATTVVDAISDDGLTEVEYGAARARVAALQSAIGVTTGLIDDYRDQYSEIAGETIGSLIAIDESLTEIAESVTEFHNYLAQGNDSVVSDMAQLSNDIALIETQAANSHVQSEIWLLSVQTQIDDREKLYANIPAQPSFVTYNRIDAFTQAHDFLEAYTIALEDGKLSSLELATISQLAANAKASLYNTGDPQLMPYARQIDALARNAFRGEWIQASSGLIELQFSLPARPRS